MGEWHVFGQLAGSPSRVNLCDSMLLTSWAVTRAAARTLLRLCASAHMFALGDVDGFHCRTQTQERKNIEGSLFLLKRRTSPRFQLAVLNKLSTGMLACCSSSPLLPL